MKTAWRARIGPTSDSANILHQDQQGTDTWLSFFAPIVIVRSLSQAAVAPDLRYDEIDRQYL